MEPFAVQGVLWGLPELPRACTICRVVKPAAAYTIKAGYRHSECRWCRSGRNVVYRVVGTSQDYAPNQRQANGHPRTIGRRSSSRG